VGHHGRAVDGASSVRVHGAHGRHLHVLHGDRREGVRCGTRPTWSALVMRAVRGSRWSRARLRERTSVLCVVLARAAWAGRGDGGGMACSEGEVAGFGDGDGDGAEAGGRRAVCWSAQQHLAGGSGAQRRAQ
jgi:hypothetical protein